MRAIGPSDHSVSQAFGNGQSGTRPGVGRKPTTLQKLPGLRSDAPRSEPSAKGSMPQATATAAPPEEPPQVFDEVVGIARRAEDRVEGLRADRELRRVGLADGDRAGRPQPLDDGVVLRRHVVAVDRRAEGGADALGRHDVLVRDRQAGERAGCRRRLRSSAFALFSACSGRKVTIAFTFGFTRSMRAMKARITSVTETLRARIMRTSFFAPV